MSWHHLVPTDATRRQAFGGVTRWQWRSGALTRSAAGEWEYAATRPGGSHSLIGFGDSPTTAFAAWETSCQQMDAFDRASARVIPGGGGKSEFLIRILLEDEAAAPAEGSVRLGDGGRILADFPGRPGICIGTTWIRSRRPFAWVHSGPIRDAWASYPHHLHSPDAETIRADIEAGVVDLAAEVLQREAVFVKMAAAEKLFTDWRSETVQRYEGESEDGWRPPSTWSERVSVLVLHSEAPAGRVYPPSTLAEAGPDAWRAWLLERAAELRVEAEQHRVRRSALVEELVRRRLAEQ